VAILSIRDMACTLCQTRVALPSVDFLQPEPVLCDQCLVDVWELEGEALVAHVSTCLAGNTSPNKAVLESSLRTGTLEETVVHVIRHLRQRWDSAEDLIDHREIQRRALGD